MPQAVILESAQTMEIRKKRFLSYCLQEVSPLSLGVFRIFFGCLMIILVARYFYNGWINKYFIETNFHFKYWGFEWVQAWPEIWMYIHFIVMGLAAIFITLGLFYKIAILLFFILFTYFHLIDVTIYLNHYYLISLIAFLLIFLPANNCLSLDKQRLNNISTTHRIHLLILQLQIAIVYFFSAIGKLNYDWLFHAQPLAIWLQNKQLPLMGDILHSKTSAFLFSYAALLFDLLISVFLWRKNTRFFAYLVLIIFHLMTFIWFDIGMFPWLMIFFAPIFFDPVWPQSLIGVFTKQPKYNIQKNLSPLSYLTKIIFISFFLIQFLLPMRRLLYSGNLFWHEQGFRFSWLIMVMQKSGRTHFMVKERESEKSFEVNPRLFLSNYQVVMMSTQPDLILQFAQFLRKYYQKQYKKSFQVFSEAHVSLNDRKHQLLIDKTVDLTKKYDNFKPKTWIKPLYIDSQKI